MFLDLPTPCLGKVFSFSLPENMHRCFVPAQRLSYEVSQVAEAAAAGAAGAGGAAAPGEISLLVY